MKIVSRVVKNLNWDNLIKFLYFVFIRPKSFRFIEKYLGLHISLPHFSSPIPVTYELDSSVFEKIYDCTGLDWNLTEQLEYLKKIFPKYSEEYSPSPNSGLSLVDTFALYVMIREKKPKIMIEIGAGETTKISLRALQTNKNEGTSFKFYSVEPYPREYLWKIQDEDFELIDRKLQDVEIDLLSTADLLFVDSRHVSKIGSDVNYEILEIVPKLKVGALIHWHDIVIPSNYPKDFIDSGLKFWNESYMLHAFMLFNTSFKTIWAGRYMQLNHFDKMQQVFSYLHKNHRLTSFWIERIK